MPGLDCDGELGVRAHCTFRGISIVQVAPGVHEVPGVAPKDGYAEFITERLADDPNRWRICSWHKNQRDMQTGDKDDETGWGVYDACLAVGGIVATGHEHVYARTHLMSDFRTGTVVDREGHLEIGPGRSFAFVSGLGGRGARAASPVDERWASIHSAETGAEGGALFCTFDEASARCRFEDVSGAVPDTFSLASAHAAIDDDRSPRVVDRFDASEVASDTGESGLGAIGPSTLLAGLALFGWSATRGAGRSRRSAPS